jgi:RNA polymerase sigma factor (TIGR02999 family)
MDSGGIDRTCYTRRRLDELHMAPPTSAVRTASGDITHLLQRHRAGDRSAFDVLVPLIYDRLRRMARWQLSRAWSLETLSPTSVVHEAYMQLSRETRVDWQSRSHFFGISARVMRRIVVDYARRRNALKRGAARPRVSVDAIDVPVENRLELVLGVDEVLDMLEGFNPRLARIVECRFFAGMTEEETAEALQIPLRTAQREWARARAWLLKELRPRKS